MNGTYSNPSLPTEVTRPHRVLLVDDEPAILRLLTHLLRKAGYEVASAQTAREALSFLARFQFDCVVSDAMMPDLSGFDFVKLIREDAKFAQLPVLMLTRNRTIQDVKRAVDLGVSEYVLKPVDTQLLLEKLEYCLAKAERPGGRFFELTLVGVHAQGEIAIRCEVRSIGEAGITLALESTITQREVSRFDLPIFREIGILPPHLRLVNSVPEVPSAGEGLGSPKKTVCRYSFVGIGEGDLKKIRLWLQRESSRRRKE